MGLAASIGAGISMGFAEALSDDGSLTGRGHPWARGLVCGLMTTAGGLGHSLPYLISRRAHGHLDRRGVVLVELGVIAWVRRRFMDTPWSSAVLQVVLGGALVFLAGVLIGKVVTAMIGVLDKLGRQSRRTYILAGLVALAVIGMMDYLTGFEMQFSVFYLLGVGLAAWFVGRVRPGDVGVERRWSGLAATWRRAPAIRIRSSRSGMRSS